MIVDVCEYATIHSDGTFTILRGGIERWPADTVPTPVGFMVFIECAPGSLEVGRHVFQLSFSNVQPAGQAEVVGEALIHDSTAFFRVATPIAANCLSFARYEISVRVGKLEAKKYVEIVPNTK